MKKKSQTAGVKASPEQMREAFAALVPLLKELEPLPDDHDVFWDGPFWVDDAKLWHPTSFTFRKGKVTGTIQLRAGTPILEGILATGEVACIDLDRPGWPPGSEYWPLALPQVVDTLREAVKDLDAYQRRVEEQMPIESRTGKVARRLTWPAGEKTMPAEELAAAREAVVSAARRPPLPSLSAADYLRIAERCYDAAYPYEKRLPAEEKHRSHADKRHGGMLDLPPEDAAAFAAWFTSPEWQGAHPFEIAYGIPHGIVLRPQQVEGGWRFTFSAQDEIYLQPSLRMAIAMDHAEIPFEFAGAERVLRTVEGIDDVTIGPDRGQLPLERLRRDRPDAVGEIRWSPIPTPRPVTPGGRARIAWVEENGTLTGFGKG